MSIFRGIATGFLGGAIADKEAKDKTKAEVLKGAAQNYYTNTLPQTIEMESNRKNSYDRIATIYGSNAAELADINNIITGDGKGFDSFEKIMKDNNLKKDDLKKLEYHTNEIIENIYARGQKDNFKEDIESIENFFSYWEQHINKLK